MTEGALLLWLNNQNVDYLTYRHHFKMVAQLPFSTEQKYMITAGRSSVIEGNVIYIKGAPEMILSCCSRQLTSEGMKKLDDKNKWLQSLHEYQEKVMRALGIAYNNLENQVKPEQIEKLDNQ